MVDHIIESLVFHQAYANQVDELLECMIGFREVPSDEFQKDKCQQGDINLRFDGIFTGTDEGFDL